MGTLTLACTRKRKRPGLAKIFASGLFINIELLRSNPLKGKHSRFQTLFHSSRQVVHCSGCRSSTRNAGLVTNHHGSLDWIQTHNTEKLAPDTHKPAGMAAAVDRRDAEHIGP